MSSNCPGAAGREGAGNKAHLVAGVGHRAGIRLPLSTLLAEPSTIRCRRPASRDSILPLEKRSPAHRFVAASQFDALLPTRYTGLPAESREYTLNGRWRSAKGVMFENAGVTL